MTLSDLQSRLRTLVAASPLLVGRPVLVEDQGNLVSELEVALSTQSLAVTIASSSGIMQSGSMRGRGAWDETFEIVIHRGMLDAADVPSTLAVLEDLRARLHGAPADPQARLTAAFACARHDLREGGDGTYARVLNVTTENTLSYSG